MRGIDAAPAWAAERCGPLAAELLSASFERGPAYAALWHALRVRRVNKSGKPWGYHIGDEAAEYLLRWAFISPDAFDVAKDIAHQNVFAGVELPTGLRRFVCTALSGDFRRPRARGRSRDENWLGTGCSWRSCRSLLHNSMCGRRAAMRAATPIAPATCLRKHSEWQATTRSATRS